MKEINLPSGNYIFVEVPNDAKEFKICFEDSISKNEDVIISTTNDITKEQCESIVSFYEMKPTDFEQDNYFRYNCYLQNIENEFETAKESLQSLIQSVGLDIKQNYLILKKI